MAVVYLGPLRIMLELCCTLAATLGNLGILKWLRSTSIHYSLLLELRDFLQRNWMRSPEIVQYMCEHGFENGLRSCSVAARCGCNVYIWNGTRLYQKKPLLHMWISSNGQLITVLLEWNHFVNVPATTNGQCDTLNGCVPMDVRGMKRQRSMQRRKKFIYGRRKMVARRKMVVLSVK